MERQSLRSDNGRMDQAVNLPPVSDRAGSAFLTDDREWIDRIRGGSTRALESLFRTHARGLTAFAFRYVQTYDAAARVVDEVFARLWRGRHSWAFHGSVRGNLYAATHRVSLEELKRTRSEARWHAGLPVTDTAAGELDQSGAGMLAVGPTDLHAVMHDTIARLPAVTRTVAFMRWADRLTREEIATVMGSNVRTVHTQITPASRAMRKRLAPTNWVLEKRSAQSTLRDAGEGVDPFPMIDPDRIERHLAGESSTADAEELCRDVAGAGGDPTALEAMESAWYGPGRIIADVVDPDAAWHSLSGKLSFGRSQGTRGGGWRPSLPDAAAAKAMVRAAADAGRRQAGAITTRVLTMKMRVTAPRTKSTDPVMVRARRAIVMAVETTATAVRRSVEVGWQAVQAVASYIDVRAIRAIAIVVLGLALTASVWALLSKHAMAASAAGASAPPHPARLHTAPNTAPPRRAMPDRRAPVDARQRAKRRTGQRDSGGR